MKILSLICFIIFYSHILHNFNILDNEMLTVFQLNKTKITQIKYFISIKLQYILFRFPQVFIL